MVAKNKGARVLTRLSNYNPKGTICRHCNQGSDQIWPKTQWSLFPTEMVFQIKLDCNLPTGIFMFESLNMFGHMDGCMNDGSTPIL